MFGGFDSQIQKFEIFCDHSNYILAGDRINGKVIIEVDNEKSITELSLRCVGKANVEWTETDFGKESKREIITDIKTESFSSEEIYFDDTHWLVKKADGSDTWLTPGKSEFVFVIPLPSAIPSSFKGEFGSVKYFLQSTIKSSTSEDRETQFILNIKGHLDLNSNLNLLCVGNEEDSDCITREKYFGYFCCAKGPLGFHFSLQQHLYIPGDCVKFKAELFNLSNEVEYYVSVILIENVIFKADGQSKEIFKEIMRLKGPEVIPHCNEIWTGDLFCIPMNLPPTNLGGCEIITLDYYLKIEIQNADKVILEAKHSIIVGTIPFVTKIENTLVEPFMTDSLCEDQSKMLTNS